MQLKAKDRVETAVIFIILFLFLVLSIIMREGMYFIISLLFFVLAFTIIYGPEQNKRFLVMAVASAFLLRVIPAYFIHRQVCIEGFGGFVSGDDMLYSLKALKISLIWRGLPHNSISDIGRVDFGLNPFTYLLAVFYRFFEPNYFDSKMINCLIGSVTPLFVYMLGKRLFSQKASSIAVIISCFYPSIVRWSLGNLKDPLIILLTLIAIYSLLTIRKGIMGFFKICAILISMYVLAYLQEVSLYALLAATGCLLAYKFFIKIKKSIFIIPVIIFVLSVIFIGYEISKPVMLEKIHYIITRQTASSCASTAGYQIFDSAILKEIDSGILNIRSIVQPYLKGVGYFLLSPFPWSISTVNQLVAYPQVLIWYFLLFFSLFGFLEGFKKKPYESVFIISFIFFIVSICSMAEGNIGSSFRHRDYFAPLIFIYASAGILKLFTTARSIDGGAE